VASLRELREEAIFDKIDVRSFKFFVENVKVNIHASENSLLFTRFTRPQRSQSKKKGEEAKTLFLMDAGLTVANVID
jgi:hypothetical protein